MHILARNQCLYISFQCAIWVFHVTNKHLRLYLVMDGKDPHRSLEISSLYIVFWHLWKTSSIPLRRKILGHTIFQSRRLHSSLCTNMVDAWEDSRPYIQSRRLHSSLCTKMVDTWEDSRPYIQSRRLHSVSSLCTKMADALADQLTIRQLARVTKTLCIYIGYIQLYSSCYRRVMGSNTHCNHFPIRHLCVLIIFVTRKLQGACRRSTYRMTTLLSEMSIFWVRARCQILMASYASQHASQSLSDKPFVRIQCT